MVLGAFKNTIPIALAMGMISTIPFARAPQVELLENPSPSPPENPVLPGQVLLGKILFHEEQLSFDNTMACATCHILEAGGSDPRSFMGNNPGPDGAFFTADDVAGSEGVVNRDLNEFVHENVFFPGVGSTGRKAPSVLNSAGQDVIFWDGRAGPEFMDPVTAEMVIGPPFVPLFVAPFPLPLAKPASPGGSLEAQAAGPPTSPVEMGANGLDWNMIAAKIAGAKPLALATNIPGNLAAFIATNPTYPDAFNAVYGTPDVTPNKIVMAIANYERILVTDQAPIDVFLAGELMGAMLPAALQPGFDLYVGKADCDRCHPFPETRDGKFHNTGLTDEATDPGRFNVTAIPIDMGAFKTADIRNAKLRLPLFHDGSKATVKDAILFYNSGGDHGNPNLDNHIQPLGLTTQEIDDLTLFVEDGLLDPRVAANMPPFDRPTLRSELPPSNTMFGVASMSGTGATMVEIANSPANNGNGNFLLGVDDATPNRPAFMFFSKAADLAATPFSGMIPVPINIDLGMVILKRFTMTDGNGLATFSLPIPEGVALSGVSFFAQIFVNDPGAATGGFYGSRGIEIVGI